LTQEVKIQNRKFTALAQGCNLVVWLEAVTYGWLAQRRTGTISLIHAGGLMNAQKHPLYPSRVIAANPVPPDTLQRRAASLQGFKKFGLL
jgi:hypothetical protein